MARNPGILDGNGFKLGLFGSNCDAGLSFVDIPERWDGTWEKNFALAQLADANGIECMVANARWTDHGGRTHINRYSLEAMTWACGLLAATRNLTVFATAHVPFVHPVFVAKEMATIDQISRGRFGLNLVVGAKETDFAIFGLRPEEHDHRYEVAEEWWRLIKRVWTGEGPFDYHGQYYDVKSVIGLPRPYENRDPIMMNAGASGAGRSFAIRNSDIHFDFCIEPEQSVARIQETKNAALEHGREIDVWTAVGVVCRSTQHEVDEFLRYCVENADSGALDGRDAAFVAGRSQTIAPDVVEAIKRNNMARAVITRSHYAIFGTPDMVAREIGRLSEAGFSGMAMFFVNYLDELPYFIQEVIPRLERLGLRQPHVALSR